ncbi:MAG: hypothetical protein E3J30_10625 [Anaerolineales bacterium]|nr:MAG: hypothetical protein E3J30_10625 [Anaerolineales bacterium]
MDNTFYLKLLAEVHQGRLFEDMGQTRPLPGQSRVTFPALRKVIVTGGGFLIRTGEALKGVGAPRETPPFSSIGPAASTLSNSSVDV